MQNYLKISLAQEEIQTPVVITIIEGCEEVRHPSRFLHACAEKTTQMNIYVGRKEINSSKDHTANDEGRHHLPKADSNDLKWTSGRLHEARNDAALYRLHKPR